MDRSELIFDRTLADVEMSLSLRRHNTPLPADNLKISWDWRALNRIELFSSQLAGLLTQYGYAVTIVTKTDWTTESLNSEAEGQRILNNLSVLRETLVVFSTTPQVPGSPSRLTFAKANDIEQILFDIDQLLEWMAAEFIYSDEIYSGEDDWA